MAARGGPDDFLAPFSMDTGYFGRPEQQFMVNFRVRDLDAMLSQLRAAGVEVVSEEEEEGAGRFAFMCLAYLILPTGPESYVPGRRVLGIIPYWSSRW